MYLLLIINIQLAITLIYYCLVIVMYFFGILNANRSRHHGT